MKEQFIVGERIRNEWVAAFEKAAKILKFCHTIEEAKKYPTRKEAAEALADLRSETGYFGELQVFLLENGVAYLMDERDSYHPVGK
ncbi:MAG: hypothetical protein PUG21_02485 [Prevotella sp.]|nr:hypothetical protein [Prevotella sp.]